MKKLNIGEGGTRVLNDYVMIVQDELIEALAAFVGSFGDNIFLQGALLTIDGTDFTMTGGWCYFNGEIIRIPAHSWVGTNLVSAIAYTEIIEVPNPVPYYDGSMQPLTKETVLKFKQVGVEVSPTHFSSFIRLGTGIANILNDVFTQKIAVSGSGFAFASGVSSGSGTAITIKKRIDKTLLINGYCNGIAADSSTINGITNCKLILTLDADFRPSTPIYFTAFDNLSGLLQRPSLRAYILFPDGKLVLREMTTAANPEVIWFTVSVPLP